jgi:ABC-type transport system involved in cytochrome c biogenesis ATPase subunit
VRRPVNRGGRLLAGGLAVSRRGRTLVAGLDLEVRAGRPLIVTGPNGAGKSTLLSVLAGLSAPAAGWVRHEPPGRITWVEPGVRFPTDVLVGTWGRLTRATATSTVPGVDFLLPPTAGPRVSAASLSTGEAKRLALWAALRTPGRLVFLDEPFDHLSEDIATELGYLVGRLAWTRGIVLATNRPPPGCIPNESRLHLSRAGLSPCP